MLASPYRSLLTRIVLSTPPESLPLKPPRQLSSAGWRHTSSKCGRNTGIDLFYCENLPPTNEGGRGSFLHNATLMSHCGLLVILEPVNPDSHDLQDAPLGCCRAVSVYCVEEISTRYLPERSCCQGISFP